MIFNKKNTSEKESESLSQADESLNELRNLMLGPMQEQFDKVRQMVNMLENRELQVDEVSQVLPEAILVRSSRDNHIVKAMENITEEAIKSSVERDPGLLVGVLVPVMLPAIRRAISSLIKEMIQTFSATLEHGLSMRGLKWRYEAFKTKKPFGEVALLHSLVYQVEQVFLIHKATGLVIQSVVSKDTVVSQDPDMVSSMLTAIQDFVRDSFGASQDEGIENLQFGDRSVWIEQSSLIVLAAVVRGNAPEEFRNILQGALNAIHFENIDNLRNFDGDTDPFERAKNHLEDCLKSQFKSKEHHPLIIWGIGGLLAFLIGWWSFFAIRDHIRWKDYLQKLHDEPGIVITETDKRSGIYYVFGLRDMLSADPIDILKAAKIDPNKVRFDWELYHSSHPAFAIRRIKKILNPPDTVTFEFKDGALRAKGSAPHQWLAESEKLAEAIPGMLSFSNEAVIDMDLQNISILKEKIEDVLFFYDTVSAKIKPGQEGKVEELLKDIQELNRLTQMFDKSVRIDIIGHTDSIGTDERNLEISQKRAEEMSYLLISKGELNPEMFTTTGMGANRPLKDEITEADREFNRCVNFKVMIEVRNEK